MQTISRSKQETTQAVVALDESPQIVEAIDHALRGAFPDLQLVSTTSIARAHESVRSHRPRVIVCGLDPRGPQGVAFLHDATYLAPAAHRLLLTTTTWQRSQLEALHILAALRRPPQPATLIDLVGGLVYGRVASPEEEV
jgi:DNA-binding NarL/FixJ family response regulator